MFNAKMVMNLSVNASINDIQYVPRAINTLFGFSSFCHFLGRLPLSALTSSKLLGGSTTRPQACDWNQATLYPCVQK